MKTYIALFRGINVGGNNILPMAALKADLVELGLSNPRSYIQSGNVIFEASKGTAKSLSKKISAMVEDKHGFSPKVLLLNASDLEAAIAANPFPKATADPKTLHFFFLGEAASKPKLDAIEQAKAASESYVLTDAVFYLHAPDGIGRSKLAANVEKYLGVAGTGRNYRTVSKLSVMISETGGAP